MRNRSILRTALLVIIDMFILIGSWCLAIYLASYLYREHDPLINIIIDYGYLWQSFTLAAFWLSGVYRSLWQHIGIGMILRLVFATVICNFAVYCTTKIITGVWANPAIGMLAFFFMLVLSGGIRIYSPVLREVRRWWRRLRGKVSETRTEPIRVLMLGAGDFASTMLQNLNRHTGESRMRRVMSIVDKNIHKHGYKLHGIRVEGDDSLIPSLVDKYNIEEVLVAIPSISNKDMREIVKYIPTGRCKVRVMKPFAKQTAAPEETLKDLEISDLLGRPETILDTEGISQWIRGETIIVTGGGGSIGSELCRQILSFEPARIIILDISENNAYNLQQEMFAIHGERAEKIIEVRIGSVLDEVRINAVLEEFKPSVIFHAAAFKHVPLMEECPQLAIENNVIGTRTMGLCAIRHGVKRFVFVSTDKAVNPTNVMGASKRMSELVIQSLNEQKSTEFVAVRFGNVLGSNGSVVPLFQRQIEMGGPVKVTHPDIIRYFMTIPEAARLVIQAGAIAKGGEIFILDMGDPVRIVDLAENLIRVAGFIPGVDIKIEFTGLRPGEKLFEELLLDEEGIEKTENDKIYVAKPCNITASLEREIADDFTKCKDVKKLIHKYVPEYKNGNGNEPKKDIQTEKYNAVAGQNSGGAVHSDDVRTAAVLQ
ncbi:MAG: polysaccharide biosynthesis protein [Oscillospiraceae bacterium]|nr:polysaccharide biosynthesis protein [Oscillospiraceae bacterium]